MTVDGRVTREDIEAKVRQLQGEVEEVEEKARGPALVIAGVAAVALLTVVFLLGKRRGKRQTTTVEIRRV